MPKSESTAANANTPTTTHDRFDVVSPHAYTKGDGEAGTEWFRCGVAFPHRSGGFTLKLRTVPVAIEGEVTLIVRKREPRDTRDKGEDWNLPE
ncbi:hypothetical protein LL972_21285 [Xanthomonas campestris pv. asclepiadis]|uniref:hypothetical protein n=1 Tax=Xanthomonas campestris TaxID=339 RepID=UPI001E31E1F0|nr:hypothetical protein [Xanthomonas campestris]MCC4618481.1 hypothetical protein [Xanthomonas campestris pv. asclepiadis]